MKKLFILFCCIGLSVLILSCEKDEADIDTTTTTGNNTPPSLATVKKLDREYSNGTLYAEYSYDANGRCVKIDSKDSYTTYEYNANKVVETYVNANLQNPIIVRTYTLNADSLAQQCTYTYDKKNYLIEFEYNAQKQLTKRVLKSKSSTQSNYLIESTKTYKYNSNGDCHQELSNSLETIYDYNISFLNTLDNTYKGLDWLGKGSVHQLKYRLIVYIDNTGKVTYHTTDFTWFFDATNKALKKVSSGDQIATDIYIYK